MATYEDKKKAVLAQFFDQYLKEIYPAIDLYNELVQKHNNGTLNVMQTMFLCSVIDHFGKILRVGDVGTDAPLGPRQNTANFNFFIENYFPAVDRCKGDIIYKLFRNGVMHQFFPKAAGVLWSNAAQHKDKLLEDDNGYPRMNNFTFSNHIKAALEHIMKEIQEDRMVRQVENIYANLILTNYGFDDHQVLDDLIADYATRDKTLYDPC